MTISPFEVNFRTGKATGPVCMRKGGVDVLVAAKGTLTFNQDGYGIRGKVSYKGKKVGAIDAHATIDGETFPCIWICTEEIVSNTPDLG